MKHILPLTVCLSTIVLASCGTSEVPIEDTTIVTEAPIQEIQELTPEVRASVAPPQKPSFTSLDINFEHSYNDKKALAFL